MTIKKRLFLSNILMIVVPVLVTALVGLFCIGMVFFVMHQGAGFGFEDSGELAWMGRSCETIVREALEEDAEDPAQAFQKVGALLDQNSVHLVVSEAGTSLYQYGRAGEMDQKLLQTAVPCLDTSPVQVSAGGRSLYLTQFSVAGRTIQLALFGTLGEHAGGGLKVAFILSALLILSAIFLSILLTNRFLTRFVFRKVEGPLDLLAAGVRRIGEGDLDYRIVYNEPDEFAPVCAAFNEMAVRLKDSVERTKRDEESRKELLAGISHDLRSPLTSIQAYTEGLLDGVAQTGDARQRYLRTIRTKAADIDRLVSQLFLYSKLDLDGIPMEKRPLRLDQFAADLAGETQEDYRARGLEITLGSLAPVTVSADPEQLRRVLSNILENSVKYKKKEVGHLCIIVEQDGRLCLTDDGPGVPEEALPKLFDAFYRSDPARKNPAGGSGLGLAIAAKAVRNMGGTIRAYNAPVGGLAIEITLPKEANNHAEDPDRGG